ncbi:MAG: ABC transporter permease [Nitrososphaeria archaeon]
MNVADALLYAINALKERKVRTALTIIGILIGPTAVVAITGLTQGYGAAIRAQLLELGTNTILVEPSGSNLITQTIISYISSIKGVQGVWPFYAFPAEIVTPGGSESVEVFAINLQVGLEMAVPGIKLYDGSFPQPFNTYGAVIGWGIHSPQSSGYPSYGTDQVINLRIETQNGIVDKTFMITGVLQKFGPSYIINVDKAVFVSLQTGRELSGNAPYDGLLVVASSSGAVDYITSMIQKKYGNQLTVMSSQEALRVAGSITSTLTLLLMSTASISFIVAFVGVTTTMYTSTLERTREIGILKAIGFRNRDIVMIFVAESAMMGAAGGSLGAVLGVGASYVLALILPRFMSFGSHGGFSLGAVLPVFSPGIIAGVFIVSVIIGIMAGALPATRASRVNPVEVLRNE